MCSACFRPPIIYGIDCKTRPQIPDTHAHQQGLEKDYNRITTQLQELLSGIFWGQCFLPETKFVWTCALLN